MKNLFRFLLLTVFTAGSLGLNSCDNGDDPLPPPPPPPAELKNQYRFDNQTTDIKSLVVDDMINENMYTIILSPVAGLETYEDATAMNGSAYVNEFFLMTFTVDDIYSGGVTIDVMNTDTEFTFENHTNIATSLTEIAADKTAGITAGSIKIVDENEETMTVVFSFTLTDGRILEAQYKGNYKLPELPADPNAYFEYDGEKTEIKSMIVDDRTFPGKSYVLMSPEQGLTTYEEFTAKDGEEYIHKFCKMALGCYDIAGITIDAKNPQAYYRFVNELAIAPGMEKITNKDNAAVSAGTILANITDGKLALNVSFTSVADGKQFVIHGEVPYNAPVAPTSNYLELDGQKLAITSALYELQFATEENNNFFNIMYFTPSNVDNISLLPDVTSYYIKLKISDQNIGDGTYDITVADKLWGDVDVTLCIPETGEEYTITDRDLQGATGTFDIETVGKPMTKPNKVEFEFTLFDHTIKGSYTGDLVRIHQPDIFAFGAPGSPETGEWKSAVVDQSNSTMNVLYLSTTAGITTVAGMTEADPTIIHIATAKSTGKKIGLETDCYFVYKGKTYTKAMGMSGNMIFFVDQSKDIIYFNGAASGFDPEALKMVAFSGFYGGSFTVVK